MADVAARVRDVAGLGWVNEDELGKGMGSGHGQRYGGREKRIVTEREGPPTASTSR